MAFESVALSAGGNDVVAVVEAEDVPCLNMVCRCRRGWVLLMKSGNPNERRLTKQDCEDAARLLTELDARAKRTRITEGTPPPARESKCPFSSPAFPIANDEFGSLVCSQRVFEGTGNDRLPSPDERNRHGDRAGSCRTLRAIGDGK